MAWKSAALSSLKARPVAAIAESNDSLSTTSDTGATLVTSATTNGCAKARSAVSQPAGDNVRQNSEKSSIMFNRRDWTRVERNFSAEAGSMWRQPTAHSALAQ